MPTVHRRDAVTTDRDVAAVAMRSVFGGISLDSSDDGRPFGFRYLVVGDARLSVHALSLTGSARATGSVPEIVAVGRVRNGRFGLRYGRHEVDTTQPYLRPPGESEMRMEGACLELVSLDRAAFGDAALRYGVDGLSSIGARASLTGPRSRALGAAWRSASDRVMAITSDAAAFSSDLVRDQLFDRTVRAILGAFPLGDLHETDEGASTPQAVARATAYIDDHIREHVSLPDIADAARLSARGVQYAFRRHLGMTPLAYLRDRRLDAARIDLIASDPAVVSVGDVARTWGFAHLSRFAQAYRDRFGEYPSATIRA
ncbi:helix-turn-helix transcriptional regulator [Labedella gwakjiensis]|nr:helix-turn-helix transcriptional regulator [Labedella gwakjiensis]